MPQSLLALLHRPCMPLLMWPSMQEEGKRTSLLKLLFSGRVGLIQSTASQSHDPSSYLALGAHGLLCARAMNTLKVTNL